MITELKINWKKFRNTKYSASDDGQVKNHKTGRILRPCKNSSGYLQVSLLLDNKKAISIAIHRMVWLCFNGETGKLIVDHINNCKTDNRLCNLQIITTRDNIAKHFRQKETSSIYTGVSFSKLTKKWEAQIKENGVIRHLGHFNCAYQAYLTYQKELLRVESMSGLGDKKSAEIYQPIFDLFFNEHNLTLTLSEMDEIIQVSKKVTESMEKLLIIEKL